MCRKKALVFPRSFLLWSLYSVAVYPYPPFPPLASPGCVNACSTQSGGCKRRENQLGIPVTVLFLPQIWRSCMWSHPLGSRGVSGHTVHLEVPVLHFTVCVRVPGGVRGQYVGSPGAMKCSPHFAARRVFMYLPAKDVRAARFWNSLGHAWLQSLSTESRTPAYF